MFIVRPNCSFVQSRMESNLVGIQWYFVHNCSEVATAPKD